MGEEAKKLFSFLDTSGTGLVTKQQLRQTTQYFLRKEGVQSSVC
jgi:Ca2+-binding EF-hand superfamily protein